MRSHRPAPQLFERQKRRHRARRVVGTQRHNPHCIRSNRKGQWQKRGAGSTFVSKHEHDVASSRGPNLFQTGTVGPWGTCGSIQNQTANAWRLHASVERIVDTVGHFHESKRVDGVLGQRSHKIVPVIERRGWNRDAEILHCGVVQGACPGLTTCPFVGAVHVQFAKMAGMKDNSTMGVTLWAT
jgi:hypothetical protein